MQSFFFPAGQSSRFNKCIRDHAGKPSHFKNVNHIRFYTLTVLFCSMVLAMAVFTADMKSFQ